MEDNIKEFDRQIEQAMNENSVNPPFGMWNRISAELDATPVASTGTGGGGAGLGAMVTKSGLLGLVIIAAVESAFLVNYVASGNEGRNQATESTENVMPANTVVTTSLQQPAVTEEVTPAKSSSPITIAKNIGRTHKPAHKQPVVIQQETIALAPTPNTIANFNDVSSVPEQTTANETATNNEAYYFPPVDINIPGDKKAEEPTTTIATKVLDNPTDKKKISLPAEQKLKFKPPHKKKWGYGRFNRSK